MAAVDHPPVTARTRRLLAFLLVPLLGAVVVATVALWPTGAATSPMRRAGNAVDATVIALRRVPCADTAVEAGVRCIRPEARLVDGGRVAVQERATLGDLHVGDHVVLRRTTDAGGSPTYVLDGYRRGRLTLVAAAVAVALLLLVAGRRALRLVAALAVSAAVVLVFAIPAIEHDRSAVGVAVVAGALVATALLLVGRGVNVRTATALVGTLLGIAVAGVVAWVASDVGHLGGVDADGATSTGFVLAGMVLGAVGALAQVALDLVDATWDLRDADAGARWLGVARAGVRAGRERVASVATTLVVAYAGAGLVLLAWFASEGARPVDVLAMEDVAVVVLRGLAGVVALAAVVPLTAAAAAVVVLREAGSTEAGDPRRFRSRGERQVWAEAD